MSRGSLFYPHCNSCLSKKIEQDELLLLCSFLEERFKTMPRILTWTLSLQSVLLPMVNQCQFIFFLQKPFAPPPDLPSVHWCNASHNQAFWWTSQKAAFWRYSWHGWVTMIVSDLNVDDIYWPPWCLSTLQLLSLADVDGLLFLVLLHVFTRG